MNWFGRICLSSVLLVIVWYCKYIAVAVGAMTIAQAAEADPLVVGCLLLFIVFGGMRLPPADK